MRIVGRTVLPSLGQYDLGGLGRGALMTHEGMLARARRAAQSRRGPPQRARGNTGDRSCDRHTLGHHGAGLRRGAEEPADFGRVDAMPAVLAGMLAIVGIATLAHVVLVVVRGAAATSRC